MATQAGELDLWFVLHGHAGPVSGWAARAAVGDRLALWGPRRSYRPPPDTSAHLLVGDETTLRAICAILEELPPDHRVDVVVEAVDAGHAVDLPVGPDATVRWVFRGGDPRGDPPGRRRPRDRPGDRRPLCLRAAEVGRIRAVRSHVRDDRGLPPRQVRLSGYWRRTR